MTTEGKAGAGPGLTDTQQMMYAFGDARRPNLETAKLLETVVLSQMTEIIQRAARVSAQRGQRVLQLESLLFLMRNSPVKLQRLMKCLKAKDETRKTRAVAEGEIEDVGAGGGRSVYVRARSFLDSLDESGRLVAAVNEDYFDEVYLERLVRNDRVTRNMDDKRYEEFCKARAVGFRGNYSAQFRASMEEVVAGTDMKPERAFQDLLSYLAYETLGQLVELCLVVRRDAERDPVVRAAATRSVNTEYPCVSIPLHEGGEGKWELTGHPVTPAELREVVRRLQAGLQGARPLLGGTRTKPPSNLPLLAV